MEDLKKANSSAEESKVHVVIDLLEECSGSRNPRQDIIKVVELSQRDNGPNTFV